MKKHNGMRPQDIVILFTILVFWKEVDDWSKKQNSTKGLGFKLLTFANIPITNKEIAQKLKISESEVSESLYRSEFAGLLSNAKSKQINKQAFMDFLFSGLKYVFPTKPSGIGRGIATAHSARPLKDKIISEENYVWEHLEGNMRGLIIEPIYKTVPSIIDNNPGLYELLVLTDALRTGNSRTYKLAVDLLKARIND